MQTLEGLLRVFKHGLERKIGRHVSVQDRVFEWLVEHVADAYNKFHVHPDGRTSYQRIKGRKYSGKCSRFAVACGIVSQASSMEA